MDDDACELHAPCSVLFSVRHAVLVVQIRLRLLFLFPIFMPSPCFVSVLLVVVGACTVSQVWDWLICPSFVSSVFIDCHAHLLIPRSRSAFSFLASFVPRGILELLCFILAHHSLICCFSCIDTHVPFLLSLPPLLPSSVPCLATLS